jgi:ADP-ribose pyrophosphatase YjhB (NUDIX family)
VVTKTAEPDVPAEYDPSQFPAFAVTVDVVVLTMSDDRLQVLLVRRAVAPFEGMWAIPGGFKRPSETLDEAAQRELFQETGVDGASLLTQFGAYGDPGRDPRMNVVTVAYLAALPDVDGVVAGADAASAALVPVSEVLEGKVELAFDHVQIVRDALEFVEFPGEHMVPPIRREPTRALATVLFTDIVDSTQTAASVGDARWRELSPRITSGRAPRSRRTAAVRSTRRATDSSRPSTGRRGRSNARSKSAARLTISTSS